MGSELPSVIYAFSVVTFSYGCTNGSQTCLTFEALVSRTASIDPALRSPCYKSPANIFPKLRCLPGMYILGNPKCGTTDLFNRLSMFPGFLAPSNRKEPHWWTRCSRHSAFFPPCAGHWDGFSNASAAEKADPCPNCDLGKSFDAYADLLWKQLPDPHALTFEASASTLWDRGRTTLHAGALVPEIMREVYGEWAPRLRFVVLVRDPIARAWSEYLYFIEKQMNSSMRFTAHVADQFHTDVYKQVSYFKDCIREKRSQMYCANALTFGSRQHHEHTLRLAIGMYALVSKP